jgi:hypothetical protein
MDRLPDFPTFDVESDNSNTGPRWDRWVGRLENLFVAMDITEESEDGRKRAFLLHYVGERVYDNYMAEKADTAETYTATKTVLDTYFKPQKNTQIKMYNFQSCTLTNGQTLDEYVKLRTLSKDCEFKDTDREIPSQIIQHCSSNRLRRRALREPDKKRSEIMSIGRAMELSHEQANTMERSTQPVNAVTNNNSSKGRLSGPVGDKHSKKRNKEKYKEKLCYRCGGPYPHDREGCPAKGKICTQCSGRNHFAKVCRSKKSVKSLDTASRGCDTDSSRSESDDEYNYSIQETCFGVNKTQKGPEISIKVMNTDLTLLVDTGSSVNILDEDAYDKVGKPKLRKAKNKLLPYGGGSTIKVLGMCDVSVEQKQNTGYYNSTSSMVATDLFWVTRPLVI